jgi:hypothetical protein
MDIHLGQQRVQAYFKAFNEGNEAAHLALFHPDVVLYASGSGDATGLVAVRGVYQSARVGLGILEMHPIAVFGLHPELAVRTDVRGRVKPFEAMLVFRFDQEGAIRRLSLLYNLHDAFGG